MTILVTGASGQAGKAVIKALIKKRINVCAMVHRESQVEQMSEMGVMKTVVGDMINPDDLKKALEGTDSIYFICSAGNPDEYRMGQLAIEISKEMKLKHFIYHSVLHSLLWEMPHHKQKNQVENALVNSGLAYTIIQPAVFMQNLQMSLEQVKQTGIWHQKFYTENDTALCMVDLNDVAEAVAIIAGDLESHTGATYELCGTENLKLEDVLHVLRSRYHREITAEYISDQTFLDGLRKSGADEYKQDMMIKMFYHYNEHSFMGNARVLASLLGRKPHTLSEYFEAGDC